MNHEEILQNLADSVISGDEEKAKDFAKKALEAGIDPLTAINEGLMRGMSQVGDDFSKLKIYLPEVMMAAEAMKAALSILEPAALQKGTGTLKKSKVVIGTITGDIHDIGKNIVAMLLRANGFEVYDLGRDVPIDDLIKKAEEVGADIIAASTLLSTSMPYMEDLISLLKERGLRDKYIVMVGGGPVTREWAASIGADGYGDDGEEAVKVAKELLQRVKGK
ncbi:MAG: cobalamin B12-binding domain-containing protein [Candidatus Methanomethyliales bacterium]|nr:cobalamin B12-binding domain-containing protein [Candidatus Methanomethylicales archaeon]